MDNRFTNIAEHNREWLSSNQWLKDAAVSSILEYTIDDDMDLGRMAVLAGKIKTLGIYFGCLATHQFCSGEDAAVALSRSIHCHEISVRCAFKSQYARPTFDRIPALLIADWPVCGSLLSIFLTTENPSLLSARHLLLSFSRDPDHVIQNEWCKRDFERTMLSLCNCNANIHNNARCLLDIKGIKPGVYSKILDAIINCDQIKFANLIDRAINYHVQMTRNHSLFTLPPFNFFPFEILSFLNIANNQFDLKIELNSFYDKILYLVNLIQIPAELPSDLGAKIDRLAPLI